MDHKLGLQDRATGSGVQWRLLAAELAELSWGSGRGLLKVYWGWTPSSVETTLVFYTHHTTLPFGLMLLQTACMCFT